MSRTAQSVPSSRPAAIAAPQRTDAFILLDGHSADLAALQPGHRLPIASLPFCADPLAAITALLNRVFPAGSSRPATLHLVAHGRPGAIQIGGQWIDAGLLAVNASALATWNVARIALWSCEVGVDPGFLATLAELSGAEVFASAEVLGAHQSLSIHRHTSRPVVSEARTLHFSDVFEAATIERWGKTLALVDVSGQSLNFLNPTLAYGSIAAPGTPASGIVSVGSKLLYQNVVTGLDENGNPVTIAAVITLVATTATASVEAFDSTTFQYPTRPEYFQPTVRIRSTDNILPRDGVPDTEASASFRIEFFNQATPITFNPDGTLATGTAVSLNNAYLNVYDLDGATGSTSARQFFEASSASGQQQYLPGSRLTISNPSPGFDRFTGPTGDTTDLPGTVQGNAVRLSAYYTSLSALDFKVGDANYLAQGPFFPSYQAFFALDFSAGEPNSALGDFVWLDSNGNGIQDAGEVGINGVTVNLINAGTNAVVATTTTRVGTDDPTTPGKESNGYYQFTDLTPGIQYKVQFVTPSGFSFTSQNVSSNSLDALDSDADSSAFTQVVTLTANQFNRSLDAGLYQLASLGDRLWNYSNGNGVQDAGESGIVGQTVTLIGGGADGVINGVGDTTTTTTGANGIYSFSFSGLTPGQQYQVQFTAPAGTVFTRRMWALGRRVARPMRAIPMPIRPTAKPRSSPSPLARTT